MHHYLCSDVSNVTTGEVIHGDQLSNLNLTGHSSGSVALHHLHGNRPRLSYGHWAGHMVTNDKLNIACYHKICGKSRSLETHTALTQE